MTFQSEEFRLADALATALSAYTPGYTPAVTADARADRGGVSTLGIRVMPAAWSAGKEGWEDLEPDQITLHVAVVGPADQADAATIDAGVALAGKLRALWTAATGPMRDLVVGDAWEYVPPIRQPNLWRQDLIDHHKLLCAAIAVTYRRYERTTTTAEPTTTTGD